MTSQKESDSRKNRNRALLLTHPIYDVLEVMKIHSECRISPFTLLASSPGPHSQSHETRAAEIPWNRHPHEYNVKTRRALGRAHTSATQCLIHEKIEGPIHFLKYRAVYSFWPYLSMVKEEEERRLGPYSVQSVGNA